MRRRIQQSVDRLYRANNAHDPDAVGAVYAEDVVFFDVVSAVTTNGRDAVRQALEDLFRGFPDFSVMRVALLIDGNMAAHRWVMRGTNTGTYDGLPATGNAVEVAGASFFEYDERGFVASSANYVDIPAYLRQLGLQ